MGILDLFASKSELRHKRLEEYAKGIVSLTEEQMMQEPFITMTLNSIERKRAMLSLYAFNLGCMNWNLVSLYGNMGKEFGVSLQRSLYMLLRMDSWTHEIEYLVLDKELAARINSKLLKTNNTQQQIDNRRLFLGLFLLARMMDYHNAIEDLVQEAMRDVSNEYVNPMLMVDPPARLFVSDFLGSNYTENYNIAFAFTNTISLNTIRFSREMAEKLKAIM